MKTARSEPFEIVHVHCGALQFERMRRRYVKPDSEQFPPSRLSAAALWATL